MIVSPPALLLIAYPLPCPFSSLLLHIPQSSRIRARVSPSKRHRRQLARHFPAQQTSSCKELARRPSSTPDEPAAGVRPFAHPRRFNSSPRAATPSSPQSAAAYRRRDHRYLGTDLVPVGRRLDSGDSRGRILPCQRTPSDPTSEYGAPNGSLGVGRPRHHGFAARSEGATLFPARPRLTSRVAPVDRYSSPAILKTFDGISITGAVCPFFVLTAVAVPSRLLHTSPFAEAGRRPAPRRRLPRPFSLGCIVTSLART
ncbi:hypothetical protein ACCO45_006048 [Purpureocillium lilacinum]|uniref:Uncharacterized protein n=1 Tax=Purpureocillium lilacinum TaxID=33203 RepID=A0ACC4DX41_PURLI